MWHGDMYISIVWELEIPTFKIYILYELQYSLLPSYYEANVNYIFLHYPLNYVELKEKNLMKRIPTSTLKHI